MAKGSELMSELRMYSSSQHRSLKMQRVPSVPFEELGNTRRVILLDQCPKQSEKN